MPYSKLRMQIYKDLHTNLKKHIEKWYSYSYNQTTATMQTAQREKLFPASILGKVLAWK